jgi:two-component system cell cycle sensor histidine kinase/response regulator CckA
MKKGKTGIHRGIISSLVIVLFIGSLFFSGDSNGQVQSDLGVQSEVDSGLNAPLSTLTEEELAWLKEHPVIRVVQDPGWPPVEFADEHSEPIGMSSDYLNIIEQRLGIRFERVRHLTWQEAYARLKKWDIDMTTSVTVTPERKEFWAFTDPYMSIPIVIVTHADVTYIGHMRELSGKKVAVVGGYAVTEWIPRDFPDIELVKVSNAEEGLKVLQRGDVFAFIDNMLVISYYLAKMKVSNLKIAGETPYLNAQSMAVRKDWSILTGILQKAIDSITDNERAAIYQRWVPIRYDHGFNYNLLWQALAVFAVILAGMLFWNRKLSREIKSRQKVEAALSKSEHRFRQLFDVAPVPFAFVDQNGMLTDINDRFTQTFGFKHEDVPTIGEWRRQAYPDPEYRRWVTEKWTTAMQQANEENNDIAPTEFQVTCKDGSVRTMAISGKLIGSDFLAVFFDITERQRAEEALRESEEQFRAISEYSHNAIFIVDEKARIIWINPKALELTGHSHEQLLGVESFIDLPAPESKDFVAANYQKFLSGKDYEHHYQFNLIRADGEKRLIEKSMTDYTDRHGNRNLIMNMSDVTERERAEEALKESEELFRTLVEGAPDAIFVQTNQRFAYLNRSAVSLLDLESQDQLIGQPIIEWVHPSSRDSIREHMQHINEFQSKEALHEETILRMDGSSVLVEMSAVPVNFRGERGALIFVRDITDRKKMEHQLKQAQKMEAIGTLAGGISHDFNNLLQAINGFTQLVLLEKHESDPDYPRLKSIESAGSRAAELVRQLLYFSRKAETERKNLDLNKEVKQAHGILERTIPKMIDIELHLGGRLWTIKADPIQIEQVLLNLGTNAADAMPGGGKLIFETENTMIDGRSEPSQLAAEPGRYVRLRVSDTGHGIDQATLEHIFEPFFTTKDIGKGTGLGLASVFGIIKSHGGYISCSSEIGKGTRFDIYLPAAQKVSEDDSDAAVDDRAQGGTETILLVDDDNAIRDFASQFLTQFGYTVLTAFSGEEALNVYSNHADTIGLVIMDIGMPGMGGHQCLRELLQIDPQVKVIIATGYSVDGQVKKTLKAGAAGYVGKPYKLNDLLNAVRAVLDRKE